MLEAQDSGKAMLPLHAILCEDVRQEMNGKFMYIGVYTADMVFSYPLVEAEEIPASFMCLVLYAKILRHVQTTAELHFKYPDGSTSTVAMPVSLSDKNSFPQAFAHLVVRGVPVPMNAEGPFSILAREAGDEQWTEVYSTNMVLNKAPAEEDIVAELSVSPPAPHVG